MTKHLYTLVVFLFFSSGLVIARQTIPVNNEFFLDPNDAILRGSRPYEDLRHGLELYDQPFNKEDAYYRQSPAYMRGSGKNALAPDRVAGPLPVGKVKILDARYYYGNEGNIRNYPLFNTARSYKDIKTDYRAIYLHNYILRHWPLQSRNNDSSYLMVLVNEMHGTWGKGDKKYNISMYLQSYWVRNDSCWHIYTADTTLQSKVLSMIDTSQVDLMLGKGWAAFVNGTVASLNTQQLLPPAAINRHELIRRNNERHYAVWPVYTAPRIADGVYYEVEDFLNNKPSHTFDAIIGISREMMVNRARPKRGVFAVCYKGQPYFVPPGTLDTLPIYRIGAHFYFQSKDLQSKRHYITYAATHVNSGWGYGNWAEYAIDPLTTGLNFVTWIKPDRKR